MKKYLILIAVVLSAFVGCADDDDNNNNNGGLNTGNGTGNETDNETRGFSCTRSGSNEIILIGISEDKNTVIVNPGVDNDVYNRVVAANDSGDVTPPAPTPMPTPTPAPAPAPITHDDNFIEYRRPSTPENPDSIRLSKTMVNGADSGSMIIDEKTYSCNDI